MRIFILLSIFLYTSTSLAECNTNDQTRIVESSNLKAVDLYNIIKGKFPSWSDKFHSEEFSYVGKTENEIDVAWLFTTWGASCRRTTRLLLFKSNQYLGSYAVQSPNNKVTLNGNKLIFPFNPSYGNSIDLSNGIPKEILIDGELPMFTASEL